MAEDEWIQLAPAAFKAARFGFKTEEGSKDCDKSLQSVKSATPKSNTHQMLGKKWLYIIRFKVSEYIISMPHIMMYIELPNFYQYSCLQYPIVIIN